MSLQFLCASSAAFQIKNRKMNIKTLNILPLNCRCQVLKILSKLDKNIHRRKYNNCLVELEILLCFDTDTYVYNNMNDYEEEIILYFSDRIKIIRGSVNGNYMLYYNILNNKTWLNNKFHQNILEKIK
jgi:hypothetical protein